MRAAAMSVTPGAGGWRLLFASLLAYTVSFCWFYPRLPGVEDEAGFINQAFVWSRGALSAEAAGLPHLPDMVRVAEDRHVSWRNPGRSLTLLPMIATGQDHLIFATGALIHVATVLVGALVLVGAGASPAWASLILFHPTLSLYSRTVMADGLAGLLLLGAVWAALAAKPRAWAVGLMLGLAVVARQQAAIVAPLVLLVFWRERGLRAAAGAALLAGLAGLGLLLYNQFLYGRPEGGLALAPGMPAQPFSLANVWAHLPYYATALMVVWPAQLLALAFPVGPLRRYACAVCLPVLALLLAYFYRDRGPDPLRDLVVGQRLLQIALPVWVVCYALVLHRLVAATAGRWPTLAGESRAAVAATVVCVALAGAQALMFQRHQQHLSRLAAAKQLIIAEVPRGSVIHGNQVLHKLFWTYPDCERFRWRGLGSRSVEYTCLPGAVGSGARYVAYLAKVSGSAPPPEVLAMAGPVARNLAPPGTGLLLFRVESGTASP